MQMQTPEAERPGGLELRRRRPGPKPKRAGGSHAPHPQPRPRAQPSPARTQPDRRATDAQGAESERSPEPRPSLARPPPTTDLRLPPPPPPACPPAAATASSRSRSRRRRSYVKRLLYAAPRLGPGRPIPTPPRSLLRLFTRMETELDEPAQRARALAHPAAARSSPALLSQLTAPGRPGPSPSDPARCVLGDVVLRPPGFKDSRRGLRQDAYYHTQDASRVLNPKVGGLARERARKRTAPRRCGRLRS